jgi:hypothetical protein
MSELSEFQKWVGEWGNETFNPKRGDNSKAIVHHLEKEVCELMDSNSPEEAADRFILLLHHAHTLGYDLARRSKEEDGNQQREAMGLPRRKRSCGAHKMRNYFIGIDTGWSGAIAIYNGNKYFVYDCPNPKGKPAEKLPGMVKFIEGLFSQQDYDDMKCFAMIEEPFAIARRRGNKGKNDEGYDSGVSMLSYGANHGAWLFALHWYGMQVKSVHPRTWQAALGLRCLPGNNVKEQSRFSALQLAPYLEKQLLKSKHGRADAINIAYYLSTLTI